MPKLKQPISLQKITFNFLVTHVVHCCDSLSINHRESELRLGVGDIKQHLRDHLAGWLFVKFCRKFFEKFYSIGVRRSENRPASHHRAVLEMIMDLEIIGLIFEGRITRYLDLTQVHRLKGLKVLDWTEAQYYELVASPWSRLKSFSLQDLTAFIYPRICTDRDLEIIGSSCLKLRVLRIEESENVTDRGLRALHPCSQLRIINLHYCSVSDDGVNEFLNVHKKLQEFNIGDYYTIGEKAFDILSRPLSSVCQSVKRFALKSDLVTNADLHSVVALFPNLTHIQFCSRFIGDLCVLRDLKSLRKLDFGYSSSGFNMENIKQLLTIVGANILQLTFCSDILLTQDDLKFIFKTCVSIEYLHFGYRPHDAQMKKLVIPSFQKLKYLDCVGHPSSDDCPAVLEFRQMPKLESLRIKHFDAIFQIIESMILDHVNFPNLREVSTFHNYHHREIINRITQISRNNNLDFSLILLR